MLHVIRSMCIYAYMHVCYVVRGIGPSVLSVVDHILHGTWYVHMVCYMLYALCSMIHVICDTLYVI